MDEQEFKDWQTKSVGDMDQAKAGLKNVAEMIGAYRGYFLAAGVPEPLVDVLIRDYHWLSCHKMGYPDQPPQGRPE